jgi:hypothetical protein
VRGRYWGLLLGTVAAAGPVGPAAVARADTPPAIGEQALPAGIAWVRRLPGAPTATLYWSARSGAVVRRTLPIRLNAVGCGPDGALYGLSTRAHLIRVPFTGEETDLGTVGAPGRYALARAYAGTGRSGAPVLTVRAGDLRYDIRLGPGPPTAGYGVRLPALPFGGDWAEDPRTGDLVYVTVKAGRATLVRLPRTGRARFTALPALRPAIGYGAATVTSDHSLYTMDNRGTVYRIPLDEPFAARAVWSGRPVESSDAAACEPSGASAAGTVPPSSPPVPVPVRQVRSTEPADVPPLPATIPSAAPVPARLGPAPQRPPQPRAATTLRDRLVPIGIALVLAATAMRLGRRKLKRQR